MVKNFFFVATIDVNIGNDKSEMFSFIMLNAFFFFYIRYFKGDIRSWNRIE